MPALGLEEPLRRDQLIAGLALGAVALFAAFTIATRYHEGRCHVGGRRGGLDCSYPAATAPTRP